MARKRPTIADLQAIKGQRQLAMMRVTNLEELAAAERAGIDMVSVPPDLMLLPAFREIAPSIFAMPGDNFYEIGTADDFVRWAFRLYKAGADAVYCSASFDTVRRMADEGIPVIGHVGLIPSKATWTGGFKAVGKTADGAVKIMEAVRRYEAAGAFGAEIEVVPAQVATAISARTPLFMISMGAGTGCDAQYLFAEDVLGYNRGLHRTTGALSISPSQTRDASVAGIGARTLRLFRKYAVDRLGNRTEIRSEKRTWRGAVCT